MTETADPYRCGYVALAGRPNVGKSTLLNELVGQHLSIVASKAQTTRERVTGILTTERFQIVLIDAPGLFEPQYALQKTMRWAARQALEAADVVALISDATRPETLPDDELAELVRRRRRPVVVALNKRDLVDAGTEARLLTRIRTMGYDAVPVCASSGERVAEFVERLVQLLPESPPLFPVDDAATQPLRFFAAEFVRETCVQLFRDEIPYSIVCRVDDYREEEEPVYIRISIFVERESQKGIVIGRGGVAIRQVGELSRSKIEELIGRQVYLDLRVKVMPGWSRKRNRLKQLGYDFPPATRRER